MTGDQLRPDARSSRLLTRVVAIAALAAALAYLSWRVTVLDHNPWLSIPLFAVELWGAVQLMLIVSQAWGTGAPPARVDERADVDIVVTATFHSPDQLERTLIGCTNVRGARGTRVVLREDRPELADVCQRFDVLVETAAGNHADLFEYGAMASEADIIAWLEAGQIPMPDFVVEMAGEFADDSVATVQSSIGLMNADSFAHVQGGRDEDAFRQYVVHPAMGRQGHAPWFGGGALVRREAIIAAGGFDAGDQAAVERALVRLHGLGWTSRFHHDPELVRDTAPDTLDRYLALRRRRAIEAIRVFRTADNPLLHRTLPFRARVSHLASAAAFGTGVRQSMLTAVLILTLLTGRLPVGPDVAEWLAWWLPGLILSTVARAALGRGTMRVGDWSRQGWRTLSADLSAFVSLFRSDTQRPVVDRHRTGGFRALGSLRLVTGVLLALDVVLVLRGLTVFYENLLPPFTATARVVALGLGLATSVVLIDVLQVVVRRRQRRATFRLETDLQARLGQVPVSVVDMSPHGVGVVGPVEPNVGDAGPVQVRLPGGRGGGRVVTAHAVVRAVDTIDIGTHRLGLEFTGLDDEATAALIEYCAIGHHLIVDVATESVIPHHFDVARPRRSNRGVQLLSAAAIFLGAMAVAMGPSAAPAFASGGSSGSICAVDSTGAPLSGVSAYYYHDGWAKLDVTGNDGCAHGHLPAGDTTYAVGAHGVRTSKVQDVVTDPVVRFHTVATTISVKTSDGAGVEGAAAGYYASGWRDFGITGPDGTITRELFADELTFSVRHRGVANSVNQNTAVNPVVEFATVATSVRLTDSNGGGLADGAVSYHANGWQTFGTTGVDGVVVLELLPAELQFEISHRGVRDSAIQHTGVNPVVSFTTVPVQVSVLDSTGSGVTGATASYYANGWKRFGTTGGDGVARLELLPADLHFEVRHLGVRNTAQQDTGVDPVVAFSTVPVVADDGVEVDSFHAATPPPTTTATPTTAASPTPLPDLPLADQPPPTATPDPRDNERRRGDDGRADPGDDDPDRVDADDRLHDGDDHEELPDHDDIEDIDDIDDTDDFGDVDEAAGAPDDYDLRDLETGFSVGVPPGEEPAVFLEKGSPRLERSETGEPMALVYGVAVVNEREPDGDPIEFALTFDEPVVSAEVTSSQWECRTDGEAKLLCHSTDSELALGSVSLLELTVGLAPPPELGVRGDGPSSTDLAALLVATAVLGLVVYWFVSGRRQDEEAV